jgi:hypothetical protein
MGSFCNLIPACNPRAAQAPAAYSVSKPLLLPNFRVRLFSVTVRTTLSGAPAGVAADPCRVKNNRTVVSFRLGWLRRRRAHRAWAVSGRRRRLLIDLSAGHIRHPRPRVSFSFTDPQEIFSPTKQKTKSSLRAFSGLGPGGSGETMRTGERQSKARRGARFRLDPIVIKGVSALFGTNLSLVPIGSIRKRPFVGRGARRDFQPQADPGR